MKRLAGGTAGALATVFIRDATRGSGVYAAQSGQPERTVVISESDLVTAVLAAAAITTLRRHSIRLPQGRIALKSPEVLPRLRPVLRSAEIATVTIVSGHEHGCTSPQRSTSTMTS